jgi:hypothetical protein
MVNMLRLCVGHSELMYMYSVGWKGVHVLFGIFGSGDLLAPWLLFEVNLICLFDNRSVASSLAGLF